MHIDAALSGVPESDRCADWRTGKCQLAAKRIFVKCENCGLEMFAETEEGMQAVVAAHAESCVTKPK